jgi:5-methylcytosine-specific restriction endonuclease McrA
MAIGAKLRFTILKRDGYTCQYCFRKGVPEDEVKEDRKIRSEDPALAKLMASLDLIPEDPLERVILEVDHIVPKSLGGTDDESNLVTSCLRCNRGKGKQRP